MVTQEEARRARRSRIEISPDATRQLQSTRAPLLLQLCFYRARSSFGGQL